MRADRLLKLMLLLQNKGKMTAAALAEELEVSRRTILRDVDALSFAGVPVYTDGGHGGGISLDENYRVQLNGLREAEVQALMVSNNASLLADIGLADAAEQSLLKLLTALPSLHEQSARQFQNRLYIDPVGWWHGEQTRTYLNEVQAAVYRNDIIEMVYQKHDGTRITRTVQPYGLVAKASVWYLIAKHADMFRSYRISRIKELRLVNQTFLRDADFNLAEYWQTSTSNFLNNVPFYTFTLAIHPEQKNYVTWYVPGFCELQGTTDAGWPIGHFYVDNLELAASFVLGLGQKVHILEPEELQEAVTEKIQALIVMAPKS